METSETPLNPPLLPLTNYTKMEKAMSPWSQKVPYHDSQENKKEKVSMMESIGGRKKDKWKKE